MSVRPKFRVFRHREYFYSDMAKTNLVETKTYDTIHEVVYDMRKKNQIFGFKEIPAGICGKTMDEMKSEMKEFELALSLPVLDDKTMEEI